jgi:hypothetical protein
MWLKEPSKSPSSKMDPDPWHPLGNAVRVYGVHYPRLQVCFSLVSGLNRDYNSYGMGRGGDLCSARALFSSQ